MVEEMKEYILKYSSDEKSVLKMAEKVIKDYNLSENKQRLIVAILDYCGVSISEEELAKTNAEVEYYGAVGDKFELTLTFDKSFGFEGAYGFTYIHLFHDDENHVFAWSSSNGTYQCWYKTNGKDGFLEYEVGKKYILKGTIKAHKEYRNVKQTVITRCKVLKDEYESHVFNKKEIEKVMKSKESAENAVPYEDPFDTLMEVMASVEQSA